MNPDTDADGILDGIEDTNLNGDHDPGETDPLDDDSDDDSLLDGVEDANQNGNIDLGESDPNNPDDRVSARFIDYRNRADINEDHRIDCN